MNCTQFTSLQQPPLLFEPCLRSIPQIGSLLVQVFDLQLNVQESLVLRCIWPTGQRNCTFHDQVSWAAHHVSHGTDCVLSGRLLLVERMLLEEGLSALDYIKTLSGEFRKNWKKLKNQFRQSDSQLTNFTERQTVSRSVSRRSVCPV